MNAVVTLALKDLKLLVRNRVSLFWILFFPLMLALFFGTLFGGGDGGARPISLAVVDEDGSKASKALVERLGKLESLNVEELSRAQAHDEVRRGKRVAYLVVPKGYGKAAARFGGQGPALEIGIDPSRRAEKGYLQGILSQALFAGMQESFSDPKKLQKQLDEAIGQLDEVKGIKPEQRQAFKRFFGELVRFADNVDLSRAGGGSPLQPAKLDFVAVGRLAEGPQSAYEVSFPSSILWGILGCVQTFVISIVSERVGGTFLRLRISPLSWAQVLAGKALACFLACSGVSVVLLVFGRLVFGVRLEQPLQLTLAIVCTSCCFVGILMLLATLGKTVEGVAGAAWGILMPLAMIGGGMVPLMVMPDWMLRLSDFSPVKWGIISLEGAVWRGYSVGEMLLPCGILLAVGAVCFAAGVRKLSWSEA